MSRILKGISIAKPCSADWDQMKGNDRVRFCEHCDLSVTDLSEMTRARAELLVRRSKGRLCLRIRRDAQGDIVTRPLAQPLYKISARASRIAAGAFTAMISMSAAAYAQTAATTKIDDDRPVAQKQVKRRAAGTVSHLYGTVTDQNSAVIEGAKITVTNQETGEAIQALSTEEGKFSILLSGDFAYGLKIELPGFDTFIEDNIELRASGEDTRRDVVMNVGMMGDIVTVVRYQQPLVRAAENEDPAEVQALLRQKVDVDQAEDDGTTALMVAVMRGNLKVAKALVRAGGNLNAQTESGLTALSFLDEDSKSELVELLLRAGADPNLATQDGQTPLMGAAEKDRKELIEAYVKAGAQVDLQDHDGNTALMIAAREGSDECVDYLINAGANIHFKNRAGADAWLLAHDATNTTVLIRLERAGAVPRISSPPVEQK